MALRSAPLHDDFFNEILTQPTICTHTRSREEFIDVLVEINRKSVLFLRRQPTRCPARSPKTTPFYPQASKLWSGKPLKARPSLEPSTKYDTSGEARRSIMTFQPYHPEAYLSDSYCFSWPIPLHDSELDREKPAKSDNFAPCAIVFRQFVDVEM